MSRLALPILLVSLSASVAYAQVPDAGGRDAVATKAPAAKPAATAKPAEVAAAKPVATAKPAETTTAKPAAAANAA
jgi:hypothetical protein